MTQLALVDARGRLEPVGDGVPQYRLQPEEFGPEPFRPQAGTLTPLCPFRNDVAMAVVTKWTEWS